MEVKVSNDTLRKTTGSKSYWATSNFYKHIRNHFLQKNKNATPSNNTLRAFLEGQSSSKSLNLGKENIAEQDNLQANNSEPHCSTRSTNESDNKPEDKHSNFQIAEM